MNELLSLPLERGVNPAADNNAALQFAVDNGRLDVLKELIALPVERGVNPTAGNNFVLGMEGGGNIKDIRDLLLKDPRVRALRDLDDLSEGKM